MKKLTALAFALGLLSATGLAEAQDFGTQGRFAFGAERMFGLTWGHHWVKSNVPGQPDAVTNVNGISLLWNPVPADFNPYTTPRAAIDYFVIDHLSLGGTIGYISGSSDREEQAPNGATRTISTDYSAFVFAPRAGYAYMFGSVVGIWPHGGLTYYSYSVENNVKGNGFGVSLDCQVIFAIAPHFGVSVGPTLDLPLTGTVTPQNGPDQDEHYRQFGIQAGLFGWI